MKKILYILMRNDLPSMTAGKAMAQASHASNHFVATWPEAAKKWNGGGPFGTVVVLTASAEQIDQAIFDARANKLPYNYVYDETYPYRTDKEIAALIPTTTDTAPRVVTNERTVTLFRRAITCAYVCGAQDECKPILGHLPLY